MANESAAEEQAGATPAPATISLPLTFNNSFWSTDYRTGFNAVYDHLQAACTSSQEIIQAVHQRAGAERAFSRALLPPALREDGFGLDEGASSRVGYEAVLTAQVGESRARLQLADDLIRSIATPFEAWSASHSGRIASSRALVESHLITYERQHSHVLKLKSQYDDACRLADQAEDELNFSRASASHSPSLASSQPSTPLPAAPAVVPASAPSPPPPTAEEKGKSKELPPVVPSKERDDNDDDGSLDGIDNGSDDDDTVIPRSGLVGGAGSLTSALGRALTTVRRKAPAGLASPAAEGGEGKVLPTGAGVDPAVGKAVDWGKTTFSSLIERVAGPQTGEARHERARKAAEEVEAKYKTGVLTLDNLRLTLEEALAEHLTYTQRCESDRLKAAASVLRSFHVAVAALPKLIASSHERVGATLELMRPEKDVQLIIERKRTGPFQPKPVIFHSHYSEPAICSFGIDLRKFDETNLNGTTSKVPPILSFLLEYMEDNYPKMSDSEKRKSWLYETPLAAQHHLRSALNGITEGFSRATVAPYDLPVVASVIKLWLLELEVPPITYSHYDEFRHLYPSRVGAETVDVPAKAIADHVSRLPPVHLEVLRALITHFASLISSTKTDEADEVYLQKLSLSLARCIMRPKHETAITLHDRFPSLLFADLLKGHQVVFQSADELKIGRDDRYKPRRQRTKPVDTRISRSKMGLEASEALDRKSADALLREQQQQQQQASPPVLPHLVVPGHDGTQAPSSEGHAMFAASPLDFTAPGELPPPVPAPAEVEVEEQRHPEPSAPVDEDDVPLASPASRAPAVEGGSISRSTKVRGARGPRPLSAAAREAEEVTGSAGAAGRVKSVRDSFTRSSVGLEESEVEK